PRRLGQVSLFLSNYLYIMGVHDQAITAGQRGLTLATASGEVGLQALANYFLSFTYWLQGDYHRAIDYSRQAVAFFDGAGRHGPSAPPPPPAVFCCATLATCHAELGTFAEGRTCGEEGRRIAEAVAHPYSFMVASWGLGLLALRQGDLPRALP